MKKFAMLLLLALSVLGVMVVAGKFLLKERVPVAAEEDIGDADIASFDEQAFDAQFPVREFKAAALEVSALKPGTRMDSPSDDPCFENGPCFAMAKFQIDEEEVGYIVREPSTHEKPHRITLYIVNWQEAGVQQKLVLEDDTSEDGWEFREGARFMDVDGDGKPDVLKREFENPPADEADQKASEKFSLYAWDGTKFAENGTKSQAELKTLFEKK